MQAATSRRPEQVVRQYVVEADGQDWPPQQPQGYAQRPPIPTVERPERVQDVAFVEML